MTGPLCALSRGLAAVLVLAGLAQVAAAQQMPAMPVSVAEPVRRMVVDWVEFPGRFEASALVDIRARVGGALQAVQFKDGATVQQGDVLFLIDPRPYEAALKQAQANVEVSQTRVDLTRANLDRADDLRRTGNIPESTYQQRQQEFQEARGALEAARGAVAAATLDLEFTQVRAPIGGRIGRTLITPGNLVTGSAGAGTLLTTIVQDRPIHFYFDIDEQSFLTYQRAVAAGSRGNGAGEAAWIALSDETEFAREGRLDFIDNRLDEATGTIRLRAVLPNDDRFVTAGMFGRVRVAASTPYEAMVLPEAALVADQSRKIVMTVDAEGTVAPKVVETGPRIGPVRVIRSGLDGTEKVVVNGLMRARPGGKVVPQDVEIEVPEDLTAPSVSGG